MSPSSTQASPSSKGPPSSKGRPAKSREPDAQLLSDRAYEAIRNKLVTLEIAPGAPIDEERLATELGVGRTPVRAAIKRLAYQKLVVIRPRSGTFAAEMDIADLEAICEIRERLEGLAAERAALRARYEERQELRQLLERLDTVSGHDELLDLDTAIHRTVYRLTHNAYLLDVLTTNLDQSLRIWNLALERLPHLGEHVRGQADVIRAILDRDPARAREAAENHVRAFEEDVREMF
ncbi:GntR family transcriptional regulator [Planosporangium mesophilum]|uniref:GntR family transcriptional regulator n=1 Tax=Planosporangium mesophilum TaxID=689768 RepID=A0A8J3TDH7_9ACTN|nr:GntR family transcriptional regulator [Planosporangium mesophilum]NJC85745.1 GntR family transcriptional regulator [Planosporangium mesophilum]GII24788.1 GntR family transcriptional regulator [Planosporangium mesophilum]